MQDATVLCSSVLFEYLFVMLMLGLVWQFMFEFSDASLWCSALNSTLMIYEMNRVFGTCVMSVCHIKQVYHPDGSRR